MTEPNLHGLIAQMRSDFMMREIPIVPLENCRLLSISF